MKKPWDMVQSRDNGYVWGVQSPSLLAGYVPSLRPGLGDDLNVAVDPTLLIAGVGVLALAFLLMGGRKVRRGYQRRRRRRLSSKRQKLQRQIDALGA